MALKIKLARRGSKKRPFYHLVVSEARGRRDGRFVEKLGFYNPLLPIENVDRIRLVEERIKYWLGVGAKPTDRVSIFLDRAGLRTRKAKQNPKKALPKAKALQRLEEKGSSASS